MARLLSQEELNAALVGLPGWVGDTSGIARTYEAESFPAGIRLVDAVGDAAEAANHHPDIDVRWTKITFRLVTHSAGGVTDSDVAMAKEIDKLATT